MSAEKMQQVSSDNYTESEISEAATFCIASLITLNHPELTSQFIGKLGTDPKVMPNTHFQSAYKAVLDLFESGEAINALSVWNKLEKNGRFIGGIDEIMRLHLLVVESSPADIFANNWMYCEILTNHYRDRQDAARALNLSGKTGLALDRAILDEADRIIAKRAENEIVTETEEYVPFPEELLFDVFKPYAAAFKGKTEVPTPFHFAVLKTAIGATLGRRVYLDAASPIYPNFFTVIIGETGIARKSTALRLGEKLIGEADPSVYNLRRLTTSEGLTQEFCAPHGYSFGSSIPDDDTEDPATITEKMKFMLETASEGVEGFRLLVSLDEFSHLLKQATKSHSDGLIQTITELYDFPTKLDLPNRTNPLSADHPCLSIIAATTQAWLESSLKLEDIQGGFANRFSYYHAASNEYIFKSQPGDPHFLNIVRYCVSQFRHKFTEPTAFQFDEDADREGEIWYLRHRKTLKAEKNPLTREALARADIHMKKAALLHAAITNDADDYQIGVSSLNWAIKLAEYLQAVTTKIYSNFNLSEGRRLEQRIIDLLTQKPNQTARELYRTIRWTSTKNVNDAVEELVKSGILGQQDSSQTSRFYVLTEI